ARMTVKIDWIVSLEGRVVARPQTTAEVRSNAWGAAGPQPYMMLGERSVDAIAAVIQDPTVMAAAGPTSAPEQRPLVLTPRSGAPGNGDKPLFSAMPASLRAARLPLATEVDDQALVIAGSVRIAPPAEGRQKVEIVWSVQDSDGHEIAKLAQANAVP